jgi:DNA-binding transcriptional LysR family regulator
MRYARILRYVDEIARCGSIRKAAERLNVTASAMNRRVADLEDELGAPLFERKPRGVRLTAAGEVFVRYAREQATDLDRVKSQIEDLKGLRRGTVRIACSQALAHAFLPAEIAAFRAAHPLVAFDVKVLDHERAIAALASYDTDLVLVFRPPFLATFQPLMRLPQRLVALMAADHPLAAKRTVRLRDCAAYPVALAERSMGGRQLLDEVAARAGLRFSTVIESNSFEFLRYYIARERLISFQIRIGAPALNADVVAREIDDRDVPQADLVLGHIRGRSLPIATAVFAERLIRRLEIMREDQMQAA